jgi:pSer/pThr/pTyr-binding forkhead associated (FHA) protein
VQGILARVGDTFDRLTGRGWKPSSSLATSELGERLKTLVEAEIRESPEGRRYVPHNIKLKMQWDKFSTDSDDGLKKLEHELLATLIDHINDRRYFTYSPLSLEVKPDYFTNGVKLFASFDDLDEEREISLDVTVPNLKLDLEEVLAPPAEIIAEFSLSIGFTASGKPFEKIIDVSPGDRISVGRTNHNDIPIDDVSVSKLHASLLINKAGELIVADTGSTNGTFLGGQRIAYGKAIPIPPGEEVKFGSVDVRINITPNFLPQPTIEIAVPPVEDEAVRIGDFEFKPRSEPLREPDPSIARTEPALASSVTILPLTTELSTIQTTVEKEESKE